jgi:hypothetical protein
MGKHEAVSLVPPAPTARAVLAHRKKLETERDALRVDAADLALRSARGDTTAQAALWAIPARQAGIQFELDQNRAAYALAEKQDSDAEIAWRASIQTLPPEEIITGINRDECCHRCQPNIAGGCVLSAAAPYAGATCMHPTRMGSFHQFGINEFGKRIFPYRNTPQAAKAFDAACDKLNVRGNFV